ncbi:MAG: hypothetical protein EBY48_06190, partial [Opitutae bacterium]|nr:hypothetical protein [Opitutae bacterium]
TLNADLNSTGGVSYQSGQPFSGSTAPGMLMWMDGNDYNGDGVADTTDANLVNGTGWKDKSGSNRHATTTGGDPRFMSNQLNGLGVIDFDGNDNVYVSNDAYSLAAHTDAFSAFLLVRMTGYNGNDWSRVLASQDWYWYMGPAYGHTKNVAYFNGQVSPNSRDFDSRDTDWHLYQVTVSDLHIANAWRDELQVTTNKSISSHDNRKPKKLYFGGATKDKCQIAEFFIFNRVVPETERLKIEGYLARKWGLISTMFTAAHPYYSEDPYQPTVNQGGENATVTFYWGDNNGSTTPGNWDNSQAISGTHGVGVVSHALTGLTTGTTYYYTAKAVTSAGTSWAPVQTFVPANTALNKYSIADLGLWLDATDLDGDGTTDSVTSGTTVSSWTDKSVGGETVSQSTAENMPTRQANSFGSKAAVRFDGNGDILNVSTIRAESGGYSAYAAVRRPSTSGDASGHLVSESGWNLVPSGSNAGFPAIIAKKSGTAGTLTNIKLGKSASSSTNDFGGDLGELLIFSRQLTSTEEQKVEGYLAHKWGATDSLDANHPYKNVAPTFDNKPLITKKPSVLGVGEAQADFYPLHASVFTGLSNTDDGLDNLNNQTYTYSSSRVFTGASGLLSQSENTTHNVQLAIIDQDVQNWNKFPTFNGGNQFKTAFSGSFHAPVTGTYRFRWDNDDRGGMYVDLNGNGTFESTDRLGIWAWGSYGDISLTAGTVYNFFYMTAEGGGGESNNWYLTQPGGTEERVNFGKASQIEVWSDPTAYQITTGQPVSIQIEATRNPTSWSASSALTGKGLSISNSGVITGSVTALGEFNATVTASNADGNDTKVVYFNVTKGLRTITWDQTIAGLTYGDSALSLTGTATGTDVSGLPAVLPGLKLWLDASDSSSVTHSSNAVSQWSDKSGNGIHATQSTASRKPTFNSTGTNGKSVIDFDGSSDFLDASGLSMTQSYTFALVAKTNNNSTGRDFLFDGVGNNRSIIALDYSGKVQMWATSWANSNLNTPSGYFVMTAIFNSSSSSLSLNGTSVTGLNPGTSNLSGGIRIGAHKDTSDFLKGNIAEFFVLDETSNANTIAKVEGYLAHKWGLAGSLPSEHAYKATAPQTG